MEAAATTATEVAAAATNRRDAVEARSADPSAEASSQNWNSWNKSGSSWAETASQPNAESTFWKSDGEEVLPELLAGSARWPDLAARWTTQVWIDSEEPAPPIEAESGPPNWAHPSVSPPVTRVELRQHEGHAYVVVRIKVGRKTAANLPNGTVCDMLQTQGEHCQIHEPNSKLTGWVKRQNTLPFPGDQPLTPMCEPGTPTLVRLPGAGAANPMEKPLYPTGAGEAEQEGQKKFNAEAAVKEMRKRGVYSPVKNHWLGGQRDTEYL